MIPTDYYARFIRTINVKHVLNSKQTFTDTDDYVAHSIRPTDYIDLDQIDGTTHVRRLTRSYIIADHQKEPVPFDIKATKTSRASLVDPDNFAIHKQDTVFFYEAITYRRLSYIDHPLEPYQDIVRIRDIYKPVRRPTQIDFSDYSEDECFSPSHIHGWVDQKRRDLTKYQEGNGILKVQLSNKEIFERYHSKRQRVDFPSVYPHTRPKSLHLYSLVHSLYGPAHTIVSYRKDGEDFEPNYSTAPFTILLGRSYYRTVTRRDGKEDKGLIQTSAGRPRYPTKAENLFATRTSL